MTGYIKTGMGIGLFAFCATPLAASEATAQVAPAGLQSSNYGVQVDCRAVNDFGYIATAKGSLAITSRRDSGEFFVSGTLEINAKAFDAADQARSVQVYGSLPNGNRYVTANVVSGADDLQSMFLAFYAGGMSDISSNDGIRYQTDCSQSSVQLPAIADLVSTKTLTVDQPFGEPVTAKIGVRNSGTVAVSGPALRIRISDLDRTGTLFDGASGSNTLEPGAQGYVQVELPANSITRCGSFNVILDVDHKLQSGPFDPFNNDIDAAASQCLSWNTVISDETLGVPAHELIRGKTLEAIVSSQVIARTDAVCSACHNPSSGKPYGPPAGLISPTQQVGAYSWSSQPGWVDDFQNPSNGKPEYLRQAFQRWRDDGAR